MFAFPPTKAGGRTSPSSLSWRDNSIAPMARAAASEGWSVREIERRIAGLTKRKSPRGTRPLDPVVRALQEALGDHVQSRVHVRPGRAGRGKIEVHYHDPEDFERIFELLTGRSASEVVE